MRLKPIAFLMTLVLLALAPCAAYPALDAGDKANLAVRNYITNAGAEYKTAGWATYADAAGALPVDGTGGSPGATWTASTSSPLRGAASFLFTKGASNRQGDGASYAFGIDAVDQGKVISISFDYLISSGTYATGDLAVYIYDVTNSAVIQPAGYQIQAATASLGQKHIATFQTASNSTSYRLIIHCASTSASAYTLKFDNFVVGPQTVQYGAPITDWQSFTPTGTWSANTTYSGFWRRVGDMMEISAQASLSGAPTGTFSLNLPAGYSIDSSKLNSTTSGEQSLGYGTGLDAGTSYYAAFTVRYSSSTSLDLVSPIPSGSVVTATGVTATIPFTWGSGDKLWLRAMVPIVGWSSSVQMSSDTDTRVVSARISLTSNQGSFASSTDTKIIFNTVDDDTHGAYNTSTGLYTCPVPGKYDVSASANLTTSPTGSANLEVWKNGSLYKRFGFQPTTATGHIGDGAVLGIPCNAGDTLAVYAFQNTGGPLTIFGDATYTWASFKRSSGPSSIAASESVSASYYLASSSGSLGAGAVLKYDTKVQDSHNSYSTGTGLYSIPSAGTYRVSLTGFSSSGTVGLVLYKNGSAVRTIISVPSVSTVYSGTVLVKCIAGDTLNIAPDGTMTLGGSTSTQQYNSLDIQRVGN